MREKINQILMQCSAACIVLYSHFWDGPNMTNKKLNKAKDCNQMGKTNEIPNSSTFSRWNVHNLGQCPTIKVSKIVCAF
jgi:hypothetical protein